MKHGRSRRLVNIKTGSETGFDFVVGKVAPDTPLGKSAQKESRPFFPGEERELEIELDKVEALMALINDEPKRVDKLKEVFHCLKDVTGSIKRASQATLTVIELFEIKSLALYMDEVRKALDGADIPEEFVLESPEKVLNILDPKQDRINTFYIYDEYSEDLRALREKKKNLDVEIRRIQKKERDKIKDVHGILLTPKFDIVIPKSSDKLELAKEIRELEQIAEDYSSITFALTMASEAEGLYKEREDINLAIEDEELRVRERLSKEIGDEEEYLLTSCNKIGRLDYVLAKGAFAIKNNCTRPIILEEHRIEINEGRHLQVEDVLKSKGKTYIPVSMKLSQGVSCITGANMGGKTISLKLAGLIPVMAQYGYFIPCERGEIGLSNFVRILVGDSQSVERGLSSFGSEMEELKEIMDQAEERSLILVDEIASGTNPAEGLALTMSIAEYLKEKPYITLLTTHYERVTSDPEIQNMQVRGLANADFRKLNSELSGANRRQRIDIIGKYMDYRLVPVKAGETIPKDALNIARMLGIEKRIIDRAGEIIEEEKLIEAKKGDENEE